MYIVINELEKDVLREIINIGLARAADSFAGYANEHVLLDVPDVKIIEPFVLREMLHDYGDLYMVTRTIVTGDLQGKTYLLFNKETLSRISSVCLRDKTPGSDDYEKCREEMINEISTIITSALVAQLSKLLDLEIESEEAEILFEQQERTITEIIQDVSTAQPFMITIKTQFKNLHQAVELPMLVIFNAQSLFKILDFIRSNNLYDYKVLRK